MYVARALMHLLETGPNNAAHVDFFMLLAL